jgi:hypothetical protein
MQDHHTDESREILERQLANYLKTAACLTGVARARMQMLGELVRQELAELDEAARLGALRGPPSPWEGPRTLWRLGGRLPAQAGKTRKTGDPAAPAAGLAPHPGRGPARGVA